MKTEPSTARRHFLEILGDSLGLLGFEKREKGLWPLESSSRKSILVIKVSRKSLKTFSKGLNFYLTDRGRDATFKILEASETFLETKFTKIHFLLDQFNTQKAVFTFFKGQKSLI